MSVMQPAERRRLQSRADARRAILDATEALLVEDGYEAFSMRRLADRCGYTAPTIYHHFGDKQRLLDELLDERCQGLVRTLRRVHQGDDLVENLRAFSAAFVRFGLRNPTHYALLSQPRDPGLVRRPLINRDGQRGLRHLLELAQHAIGQSNGYPIAFLHPSRNIKARRHPANGDPKGA